MYDRAARVLTQPTTGTPADVGPGSYEPEKYGQKPFFKRGINFTCFCYWLKLVEGLWLTA